MKVPWVASSLSSTDEGDGKSLSEEGEPLSLARSFDLKSTPPANATRYLLWGDA